MNVKEEVKKLKRTITVLEGKIKNIREFVCSHPDKSKYLREYSRFAGSSDITDRYYACECNECGKKWIEEIDG